MNEGVVFSLLVEVVVVQCDGNLVCVQVLYGEVLKVVLMYFGVFNLLGVFVLNVGDNGWVVEFYS